MEIRFLSKIEAREMFQEPDEYAVRLPLSNLEMICPTNPTLEGYQDVFLNSFDDFTDDEKNDLKNYAKSLPFNVTIKMIKTKGTHCLDITQTRKDAILASNGDMNYTVFVHEVYHILSRYNPLLTTNLSKMFGFKKLAQEVEINYSSFLLNPDALFNDYSIEVSSIDGVKLEVTPFVVLGLNTILKVMNKDEYLPENETDYSQLIDNTDYLTHPEEICAEYFALVYTGECIFPSNNKNLIRLFEFQNLLETELKKTGIL